MGGRIRTKKVPSHSTYAYLALVGHKRTHTTVRKRVGDVDPSGGVNLHTSDHSHHGMGGYSKLIND